MVMNWLVRICRNTGQLPWQAARPPSLFVRWN